MTAEYQGKTYYFCSEGCKKEFLKDPAKYATPAAEAPKAGAMEEGCGMCCQGCCCMMAKMKMMPLKMHGQMPAPPAPGTPPPPMPPMAGMQGGMVPNCPMMKDAPMPCCPMMMRFHMGMRHGMRMGMPMGRGMASGLPDVRHEIR